MRRSFVLYLLVGHCVVSCDTKPTSSTVARVRLGPPVVIIGHRDASPGHDLHQIAGVVMLGDSMFVVADGGSNELRWFDDRGDLLFARGGQGGGATEFGAIHGLWSRSDTSIAVFDQSRQRMSIWSVNGELLGSTGIRTQRHVDVFGPLGDGFVGGFRLNPIVRREGAIVTDTLTIILYGADGDELRRLAAVPSEVLVATIHPVAHRLMQSRMPLAPRGFVSANGERVAYGFGADSLVVRWDSQSGEAVDVRVPWEAAALSPDGVVAYKQQWASQIDASDIARRRYVEAFDLPSLLPAFDGLYLDEVGRIWLRSTPDPASDSADWAVIDAARADRYTTVVLPHDVQVRHANSTHVVVSSAGDSLPELISVYRLPDLSIMNR